MLIIPQKSFDLEMTLRSSSRSKVTKVNGEDPRSLLLKIRELYAFYDFSTMTLTFDLLKFRKKNARIRLIMVKIS